MNEEKTLVKYRPAVFSENSILSILKERKTKTRRVIKVQPYDWCKQVLPAPVEGYGIKGDWIQSSSEPNHHKLLGLGVKCPYGVVGDRIWVKETFCIDRSYGEKMLVWKADKCACYIGYPNKQNDHFYLPSDYRAWDNWKSPRFMPRWASRITLEVSSIRVERLQDIQNADIRAEGITAHNPVRSKDQVPTSRSAFARYWDEINKKRGYGWDSNPWVWVVEFSLVK